MSDTHSSLTASAEYPCSRLVSSYASDGAPAKLKTMLLIWLNSAGFCALMLWPSSCPTRAATGFSASVLTRIVFALDGEDRASHETASDGLMNTMRFLSASSMPLMKRSVPAPAPRLSSRVPPSKRVSRFSPAYPGFCGVSVMFVSPRLRRAELRTAANS